MVLTVVAVAAAAVVAILTVVAMMVAIVVMVLTVVAMVYGGGDAWWR